MIQGEITKERMEGWKFDSSCEEGSMRSLHQEGRL